MLVKFVHSTPDGSLVVTGVGIAAVYDYTSHDDATILARNIALHVAVNDGMVTRLGDVSDDTGGHEAFLTARGAWSAEGTGGVPKAVWSENPDFAKLLGAFYGAPVLDTDPEA